MTYTANKWKYNVSGRSWKDCMETMLFDYW